MKKLIILFFNLIVINLYGQYCPYLGPDQYLPCAVTTTQLTADLSQCTQGSNPSQTTSYGVSQIPYVPQANTGTQLFMTDDSQQGPFNIGFNFCFFGQTYTQFWVGSNGWISFSAGQATTFTSTPIPSVAANVPKNCIMGPWQDWHPGVGGQIRYQIQGTAPCRKLVVSWLNMPMYSCTQTLGTFHIVIYESTNYIENHIQVKPNCLNWANGTAVQGIHNATGTVAVTTPGRNSTQWIANNDARRWTPSGPTVTPTLTWYQVGNPNPIGTGPTITVTPPPGGANYTCQFVYPTCNVGWASCNTGSGFGPDTVFVSPGSPTLPTPTIVATDPNCNNTCDGTIQVTPNGGNGNITISWNIPGSGFSQTNLCPGIYTFQMIDAVGCNYNGTVTINNPLPIPSPQFLNLDPICFNDCNGSSTAIPQGGTPPFTYQWSNSQTSQTSTGLCSGSYTVLILDTYGCPSQGITNLSNPPQVAASPINGSDTICFLSTNSQFFVTNQLGFNYIWQSVGNITSGQGSNSIDIDWSNQNSGFISDAVEVVAVDQNGCQSQPSSFDLTILQVNPVIDQFGPFCSYDDCITLTAQPSGGFFTINDQNVNQFCPQFNTSLDTIIYIYTQNGCTFNDSTQFIVNPEPFITNLIPENSFLEICPGDSISVEFSIQSSTSGIVDWSFNNLQISGTDTMITTWNSFGSFLISAQLTSSEGCLSNTVTVSLNIQQCPKILIYIPNSFTPGVDQYNDTWKPIFTIGSDPKDVDISIFNRWGEVIWRSQDINLGWDGTYKNKPCQLGVYVYQITYGNFKTGDVRTIIGHLTLLK